MTMLNVLPHPIFARFRRSYPTSIKIGVLSLESKHIPDLSQSDLRFYFSFPHPKDLHNYIDFFSVLLCGIRLFQKFYPFLWVYFNL